MPRIQARSLSFGEKRLNARLAAEQARKQALRRSYDRSKLFDRRTDSLSRPDND